MIPVRLFFEKRGRIKYISHLDTMRALTRSLGRAGLPLWHTEGFNPHLYLTFALPLALGLESTCESVDIRLTSPVPDGELVERINRVMPEGLRITGVGIPQQKPAAITWADYRFEFFATEDGESLAEGLRRFSTEKEIVVEKKTKKGINEVNIAPHCLVQSLQAGNGCVSAVVRLASGNTLNINATLWLEALKAYLDREDLYARITRTAILCGNFEEFR